MDYSLAGSSVHRFSQARILEWVTISFSRGSSQLRDRTHVSCIGRWILYLWATREACLWLGSCVKSCYLSCCPEKSDSFGLPGSGCLLTRSPSGHPLVSRRVSSQKEDTWGPSIFISHCDSCVTWHSSPTYHSWEFDKYKSAPDHQNTLEAPTKAGLLSLEVCSSYPGLCVQSPCVNECHLAGSGGASSGHPQNVVVQSLSHIWLFCDPMGCSLPGSSVHAILQARILEWVAISFSRGSSQPRDRTRVSCIGWWILYHWATREVPPPDSGLLSDTFLSTVLAARHWDAFWGTPGPCFLGASGFVF